MGAVHKEKWHRVAVNNRCRGHLIWRIKMTVAKSTRRKPKKPRKDFPLFAHQSGQWAKKINGQFFYFGPWGDPQSAVQLYDRQKDDLRAGREAREESIDGLSVHELVNRFLEFKDLQVQAGERTRGTFLNCRKSCLLAVRRRLFRNPSKLTPPRARMNIAFGSGTKSKLSNLP